MAEPTADPPILNYATPGKAPRWNWEGWPLASGAAYAIFTFIWSIFVYVWIVDPATRTHMDFKIITWMFGIASTTVGPLFIARAAPSSTDVAGGDLFSRLDVSAVDAVHLSHIRMGRAVVASRDSKADLDASCSTTKHFRDMMVFTIPLYRSTLLSWTFFASKTLTCAIGCSWEPGSTKTMR